MAKVGTTISIYKSEKEQDLARACAARSLPVLRSTITITHIGVSATSQGGGQVTADARVDLRALGRVLVRAEVADAVRGTRVHLEVLGG